ncbi:tetratricopeptide repeat protein [Actomonas aquatica]|uniref:Tetratricopeptide repeat protein n=1 Tax=Actomonas aquatica TaxID=2866162 RepID=A0ABZ1C8Y9_9BACT|nr:tetratricopeptide repeat protein [Opitutus sp. WL0086]WRQ88167.1 tetratricopeptide repeat protein [Opitutus sp. WL0086]
MGEAQPAKGKATSTDFESAYQRANDQLYREPLLAEAEFKSLLNTLDRRDSAQIARVQERRAIALRILCQYDRAQAAGEDAMQRYELLDNEAGVGRACVALGNIAWSRGLLVDALSYYESALEIRQRLDDLPAHAGALGSVANILTALDRLPEAKTHYQCALAICQHTGDQRFAARTHNNLGDCLLQMDEVEAALDHCSTALRICRDIDDRIDEPAVLINLGRIRSRRNEWQDALDLLDEAAALAAIGGDRRTEAEAMLHRARITEDRSRIDSSFAPQAALFRQEALQLAEVIGAHALSRLLHEDCAVAADRAGKKLTALKHRSQAAVHREIESQGAA